MVKKDSIEIKEIVYKKLEDIIPYDKNPRNNKKAIDPLKKSITNYGFNVPIIVDKDNIIITGHTRYEAAKQLKMETVPVIVLKDLADEKVKAFRIMDNKVSEYSTWNNTLLRDEIKDLKDLGLDLDLTYMTAIRETELNKLLPDEFFVKEDKEFVKKAKYDIKHGDVYEIKGHRIMCGDATNELDVMKLIDNKKANMVFTDPPFNVGLAYNDYKDNVTADTYIDFLNKTFVNIKKASEPNASVYVMTGDRYLIELGQKFKDNFRFSQILIWNKGSLSTSGLNFSDYQYNWEAIMFGWNDPSKLPNFYAYNWDALLYGWNDKESTHNFYGLATEPASIVVERDTDNFTGHPAQRPLNLVSYYLKNSSKPGQIILDVFGGSGSTLIACEKINRLCYMLELDPFYVSTIIERIEDITKLKATKLK
jgi:site-specific DNA-methyltransferase (adenine-specific)